MNECMLIVSYALLMSSATAFVRFGTLVAIVLFMLCSAMFVEWLCLKQCCEEMCGILFVMHGSSVFSSVFAVIERSEMGLYDAPMFMSLLGFGIRMFASIHMCESKRSDMLEVPDVAFIRPCGVVLAVFYLLLALCWGFIDSWNCVG